MTQLSELKPRERRRIIDLVRDAEVDVSDWGNFKGGKENAASNPRYCYEWSFVEPRKVVVLNLWYRSLQEQGGEIFQHLNLRGSARRHGLHTKKAVWEKRALKMDAAIQMASRINLPIRVIVCDGEMRDRDDPEAKASRVEKRFLDPVPWAVTAYDWSTGQCTLTRGAFADRFVDQFSVSEESLPLPERHTVYGQVFVRNPEVRRRALVRANGRCEWCAQPGFTMTDGKVFLETHHVIPLAEDGLDDDGNVVALCPNHHREAHHGANRTEMRKALLSQLRGSDAEPPLAPDAQPTALRLPVSRR